MVRRKRAILGLLALVFPAAVWAGPSGPEVLTLRQCLESALAHHPELRIQRSRVEAQGQVVRQQEAPMKPALQVAGSGGAVEGSRNAAAELRLSQRITDGGKTDLAVEVAELEREAKVQDLRATCSDLVLEVHLAFFALLKAGEDLAVEERNVAVQQEQYLRARGFYEAGKVPKSDVTAAEVDLGQARLARTKAEGTRLTALAALARAMGLSPRGTAFSPVAPDWEDRPVPSLEEAQGRADKERPDLKAQELRVRKAAASVALAAKDLSWVVSAWGGYGWSDPAGEGQWRSGLSVSLPLLDGGATGAKVAQARAQLEEARATEENLRQKADLTVVEALVELQTATENRRTSELVARQARENLDLALGRYREGVGSALEVSQASLNEVKAQRGLVKAQHDQWIARARLEHGMGILKADPEEGGR